MRKYLVPLALATSMLGAAACSAQSQPQQTPQPEARTGKAMHRGQHGRGMGALMRADSNHDGVITRAEVIAEADARFAKMDANGDGTVTADEMQAMHQAMRDRMTAAGRTPPPPPAEGKSKMRHGRMMGDTPLTKAAFEAQAVKRFDRMDANHDGKLDKTELANFAEMRKLRHREHKAGDMPPPPPAGDNGQ
jgi:hypothetical protein